MKCPNCQADNPDTKQFCGDCGTQITPLAEAQPSFTKTIETAQEKLATGSVFANRYQVIEELGKGGMGKVYRVIDKELKEEVALKLIKPEIASDKRTLERFKNELKLARKVVQKNVGRMFDLGEETGTHYITMEYVPGEDLKSFIRRVGQIPVGKAISIAKQLCEGLSEAHGIGIVHRDLKPSNIMIDKDGNARIMDFGIARSVEAKKLTGAGVIIGTPEYMSPEQVEGKETDQRSDIYSLGVILYEMLTGRLPFEGDTPLSIAVQHRSDTPKDPRAFNAQIPEDLSTTILKCLEKEKGARYQSAKELLSSLALIEQGIPTTERTAPRTKPTTSKDITVTFKRRWVLIAAPIIIILVAALAFLLLLGRKDVGPQENKTLVVLPFENLGPPEDEYFADGITDEITNRLSALHGLSVISRISAVQYKKTDKTMAQIKDELNVNLIVTGTVRWDKNVGERGQVRVSPKLIRTSDDTQLWSADYDHAFEDHFSVQTQIAQEVVKQLDLTLLEPERRALQEQPTENLEAYDFYLRGQEYLVKAVNTNSSEDYDLAVEKYEKAVELDPGFVNAFIALSLIHSHMFFQGVDRTQERLALSREAVDKALEIRPDYPEANSALGSYYYRGFLDYDRALEIFQSVQRSRPNSPPTQIAWILRRQGKWEEALENLHKAFKLNPRSSSIANNLGTTYVHMRRYDEAKIWFDRSLSLNPENILVINNKVMLSILINGNSEEARSIIKTLPVLDFTLYIRFLVEMGDRNYAEALHILNSVSRESGGAQGAFLIKDLGYAVVYFRLEEFSAMETHAESARRDLEKLVSEHPEDPRYHAALGQAYALLGRKDEAVRRGNSAIELYPVSKDALGGPGYVMDLITILLLVGEFEEALDKLDYLMTIPAGNIVSATSLRIDPRFDMIREHPGFINLLDKYPQE